MKQYALVEDRIVVNVSIADENWDSTGWIEYEDAAIGWTFDSQSNSFIPPKPECGHKELILNGVNRWECATCEANSVQSWTTA